MLETTSTKAGVLRIGKPVQPPSQPKTKSAPKDESGIHSSKNQKKKEKKKAEKEAARADQKSRFEQHRQTMRAEEASKPAPPAPVPSSSAWTTVNGGKKSTPAVAPVTLAATSGPLLDTFEPTRPTSSDSEAQQSTILGGSWERQRGWISSRR